MGVLQQLLSGGFKTPSKNKISTENLPLQQWFESESKTTGLQPFLYGYYKQDIWESISEPPDHMHATFIFATKPAELWRVMQEIGYGKTAEFAAEFYERNKNGHSEGVANGTINKSELKFVKKYTDNNSYLPPAHYEGKLVGTVYVGRWKTDKTSGGEFGVSFNDRLIK